MSEACWLDLRRRRQSGSGTLEGVNRRRSCLRNPLSTQDDNPDARRLLNQVGEPVTGVALALAPGAVQRLGPESRSGRSRR